jgi:cytochrome subunit of sulfide dehydrogenase
MEETMRPSKAAIAASIATLAVTWSSASVAQDASQARYLAANCANCHGTSGNSAGGMPSLAGVSKAQLVSQMQAFKSGQRPATIMHQLAKGYTDQQIELIADYLSRQPRR